VEEDIGRGQSRGGHTLEEGGVKAYGRHQHVKK